VSGRASFFGSDIDLNCSELKDLKRMAVGDASDVGIKNLDDFICVWTTKQGKTCHIKTAAEVGNSPRL